MVVLAPTFLFFFYIVSSVNIHLLTLVTLASCSSDLIAGHGWCRSGLRVASDRLLLSSASSAHKKECKLIWILNASLLFLYTVYILFRASNIARENHQIASQMR